MINPYREWLKIDCPNRQPNHYELLGLADREADPEAIAAAFRLRYGQIRRYQVGRYGDLALGLLDQVSEAYQCLSSSDAKAAYDNALPSVQTYDFRLEKVWSGVESVPAPHEVSYWVPRPIWSQFRATPWRSERGEVTPFTKRLGKVALTCLIAFPLAFLFPVVEWYAFVALILILTWWSTLYHLLPLLRVRKKRLARFEKAKSQLRRADAAVRTALLNSLEIYESSREQLSRIRDLLDRCQLEHNAELLLLKKHSASDSPVALAELRTAEASKFAKELKYQRRLMDGLREFRNEVSMQVDELNHLDTKVAQLEIAAAQAGVDYWSLTMHGWSNPAEFLTPALLREE